MPQNSAGSVTSLDLTSTDAELANLRPGFVAALQRSQDFTGKGLSSASASQLSCKELDPSFAFLASYQDATYLNTGKIVKISLSSFSVDTRLQRSS